MSLAEKWLITLVNLPTPDITAVPETMKSEVEMLTLFWRDHLPHMENDGFGDLEDFVEQCLRLKTAVEEFGSESVFFTSDATTLISAHTKEKVKRKDVEPLNRYGIIYSQHETFNDSYVAQANSADSYMSTDTFHRNAGRRIQLCSSGHPDGPEITDVIKSFYEAGVRDFVVKTFRSKKGIWFFNVDEQTVNDLDNYLFDIMDWSLVSLSELKDAFLVQEHITMKYEYRLFVINNEVVTGAGCIEEFSPLNNLGEIFDAHVRQDRKTKSLVEIKPDIVEKLVTYGRKIVEDYRIEQPEIKNYVLDVGCDEKNEPLMIERNSYPNSGFYACQPSKIVESLNSNH